jgi:hypothetical protein
MTGMVFTSLSKFYEIGKIVNRTSETPTTTETNKRKKKTLEKDVEKQSERKVKHFSMV